MDAHVDSAFIRRAVEACDLAALRVALYQGTGDSELAEFGPVDYFLMIEAERADHRRTFLQFGQFGVVLGDLDLAALLEPAIVIDQGFDPMPNLHAFQLIFDPGNIYKPVFFALNMIR